jgi:regulator of sigma E protease
VELLVLDLDVLTLLATPAWLGKIGNILSVVLGLGMVIFFHELGHFAVAKWCDVNVERFSIGIGPIIWSRQKGETEYALSALPFGGYVKMLGQDDMDPNQMTSDEIAENPRAYSSKKVWQRMAIISAGVIMNVITGCLFFATAYFFGVIETVPMVGSVYTGSPAWVAGVREGDLITSTNGTTTKNFTDFKQEVVLSSGPVVLKGKHVDGQEFTTTITPRQGETVRVVGIGPAVTSKLAQEIGDVKAISKPGLASERASTPFLPGDEIVEMNGQPIQFFHEMLEATARMASEEIQYTVLRSPGDTEPVKPGAEDTRKKAKLTITIPPMQFKSIGLWMAIGPVSAIKKDSIAEKAGLLLKDQITAVDEIVVGKDIDPLRLPNYFSEHAGQPVAVTVKRQTDDGKVDVTLTMVPDDISAWAERPRSITEPLGIAAIGAGFHVQDRIAHIVPGSEASKADTPFAENQKISMIELRHPDPTKIIPDDFGDTDKPFEINFEEIRKEEEDDTSGEINWAWVFSQIQMAPNRQVKIHIAPGSEGNEGFATLLKEREFTDGWYLPMRGIPGFQLHQFERKAESFGDAMALGYYQTKSSGMSIYMTLRALFQGNLNYTALSGPLGIVRIGYAVADNGATQLLKFLGYLSINLAVLNFLPIPILDGGHMFFLIWEAVSRKKPSPKVIDYAHRLGFVFIISLFLLVMYLDLFVN